MAKQSTVAERPTERVFSTNRRAFHEYHVLDTVEAGIVLTGTEIKSVRLGRVNLRDAYARVQNGEAWLYNLHISPYDQGNRYNHEPTRPRKLLLHSGEIRRLNLKVGQEGLTLVPLKLYEKRGVAKVELALVKGKRHFDKREAIAEREHKRSVDRQVKEALDTRGR